MPIFGRRLEHLDDKELIRKREKIGERKFWEEVYKRYGKYLKAVVSYKYPDFKEAAEDIVQETFMRMAFEDLSRVKNLKAFLATTAAHISIDKHRQRSAKKRADSNTVALDADMGSDGDNSFLEITENELSDSPLDLAIQEMKIEEYRKILEKLPDDCRQMLLLSAEGMKYKEISEQMGIPIGTVGTKLLRCRKKLKKLLESETEYYTPSEANNGK
ncbi:MAG TPA: sigma-70 family RNA polymerase sigma factor [Thermotogota bacterium]|nr:sigma-70 family RNA polymerase sigma factor [Thermotogota bacterium]HPJ89767.1 sigma-70 family RNA polymerase sigma factor [Thermotogota bacterium]HPR97010.1 sigma-70 family RNA polymerase sigma factor [Thermotogota bacterium]